jgi:hypothetical protein
LPPVLGSIFQPPGNLDLDGRMTSYPFGAASQSVVSLFNLRFTGSFDSVSVTAQGGEAVSE